MPMDGSDGQPNMAAIIPPNTHFSTMNMSAFFPAVVGDASDLGLQRCLDLLLADEQLLAEAARRSYRHQLGFFKFVLMADDAGRCLRMHVWDSALPVQEDIHSHCAHFQSRVVLGSLSENAFDLVLGDSHSRFLYRFDALAGHSVAVTDGVTGVCLRERRTLSRGDTYSKQATDLHSVSDAVQGTVTVSAWDSRHSEALVLKSRGAQPEDCAASAGMPVGEMRMALLNVKERIDRR